MVQDAPIRGLELRPELRDELGHRPAEVVLHRDAVDRRGFIVDSHGPEVAIDEREPYGGGRLSMSRMLRVSAASCSAWRIASVSRDLSVRSWAIEETPTTEPSGPRTGDTVRVTPTRVPSFRKRSESKCRTVPPWRT